MGIDIDTSLSDLVTADPRRTRVLEKFGIDYCCHGQRPLGEAVRESQLDLDAVLAALDLGEAAAPAAGLSGDGAALAHDIVDVHHAYMWEEMPRLQALVEKVHTVHGERHPELAEVRAAFEQAVAALDPHMTTEERVVFPAISRMEKTGSIAGPGGLTGAIVDLRAEHDAVGELFKHIRSLTGDYVAPADGCNSYRAMLAGLAEMETDLHEHIHKENNILFPRAVAMAESIAPG